MEIGKIGLTGGIASGKSTVATVFKLLNVPLYTSDKRAKEIIHSNSAVREAIKQTFGTESYKADGSYNVSYISSIVFSNSNAMKQLNQIVHPAVFADQKHWFSQQTHCYGIVESALLFETNQQHQFDKLIVVAADDGLRIQRLQHRDNIGLKEAKQRIDSQMPQKLKIEAADFVIWNNGTESIIRQVTHIDELLRSAYCNSI